MKVQDLMTKNVRTVEAGCSLKDVAALLAEHRIGGVPVLDSAGEAIGVVSKADIVIKERAEPPPRGWHRLFDRAQADEIAAKVSARTAGDAMSSPAVTITPDMPVSIAAERMIEHGINRLPVIKRGELVGIITRHDLVCGFSRADAEIEEEIRADALEGLTWPEAIEVRVSDGEVILRGQADSMFDAESLPVIVRHILGVVSVDAELDTWDIPAERRVTVTTHL
ncbi:MAG TPA: CBS domain-containing protein [Gaiellaceae bacterium]|jgi:CBS domain-containing protein